ncbi:aminopeptidase N [Novosphingobium sp. PhB165]|uniref:M1 family metallopeptidase n=1 Tax=Novosphingobium sp. PhB165 TaxID=2485105 RepID=UPI00104E08CF|nr:M1 family metallopeptidase [Novosphingobium sp. PhB165]TCM16990.1 aminopeptidase N [Novosphingobium sp. PhB165]
MRIIGCLVLFLALLSAPGGALAQVAEKEAAPVVAQEKPDLPFGRLGDSVRPLAYRLDLTVDPAKPRFSGHVEIDVNMTRSAPKVFLHGRDLDVAKVEAHVGGQTLVGQWRQLDSNGLAQVLFDRDLPAGPVTLAFDYTAAFGQGPSGLFRVEVEGAWYAWSQFQSIDARAAFPGFDQPGFKTPFAVTLRTPPGLVAISNGPEIGTPAVEGGLAVHRFAPVPPLPTYLVAVMVGPFAVLSGEVPPTPQRAEPLPLRIVSTRQNADRLAFALEGSKRIVTQLESYFGERFPFPKLDQITSPILPGAMENAGADLYRDDILVMDANAPVQQQRQFGMIVGHELGHQWFGDLVTPDWWDDLWLNESFANWIGYRSGQEWRPDLGIAGDALGVGYQAMDIDGLLAGRPIRQPIETSDQIDSAFDSITYGKGGRVVGMIADWLGEDRFREGVRRYIAAHRQGTATSADFFAALAEVAGDPRLVPAMRSFVEQQGVPLLAMKQQGDRVAITQLRYTTAGIAPPEGRWIIPICLRRAGAERMCTIMDRPTQTFVVPGNGPVFPNAGGAGYYRFELTGQHWQSLIAGAGSLPAGEALALVDSLDASIRAGRGNVGEMAQLAHALIRHPDPHAADAPFEALSGYVMQGLVSARGRQGFNVVRERLYVPLLKEFGFDPRAGVYAGEAPAHSQRRVQVVEALLATSRGGKLRDQLAQAMEAYLGGDSAALDPAWMDHALDVYLFQQGAPAARTLVEKALTSEDPVFRPAALAAAARTGDTKLAAWLLDLQDPRLREGERLSFLDGVMARSATRDIGYQWAVTHLDDLVTASGGQFFATRLPQMLGRYCSVDKAAQITRDFGPSLAGTPGALELARASERVRNCGLLDDLVGAQIDGDFVTMK